MQPDRNCGHFSIEVFRSLHKAHQDLRKFRCDCGSQQLGTFAEHK